MPTFSSAQVTDPFLSQNELLAPMLAHLESQYKLGTLDINQQELQLKKDELARGQSFADTWNKGIPTDGGGGTTAGGGGGGGSFLSALAEIESGDKNIVSGVDTDSQGRTAAQGGNPAEISQGHFQIQTATWKDFAKQAGVDVSQYPNAMSAPREVQARVASVIPLSRFGPRTQTLLRTRFGPLDTSQTVGTLAGTPALTFAPGTAGPRVATAPPPPPPPPFNPNAGPRVAGAPPAGAPGAAPAAAPPQPGFGAPTPVPGTPTVTGQADPASMEAVKKASVALLAMPEADAAVAYGPTVKALQARGLALNAPPEYPGHAALQAIVGETTAPAAPVSPSPVALRTGGTDVAGPGAGQATLPPDAQPNRMAYGTNLPGVTIGIPTNGLAPPPTAATAPATTTTAAPTAAAPPGTATRPPLEAPPAAPSRVVQREPLIQSGPAAGLTRTQAVTIGQMLSSGAKPAVVMQHADEMRHQNDVIRQSDVTQAAIEAQQNYERRLKADETQYTRGRQSEQDKRAAEELAIRQAAEKRAADEAAAKAADPLQGKSEDERIERTLLQIAPKLRPGYSGQPPTDAEKDQYTLLWNKFREGPLQQVPDGKGGFFTARVPRDVPAQFPPPPGQAVAPGPQAIPGTEKQPELAPPAVTGGMLANGVGQRKIMAALSGLLAHPDAVGLKANAPDWLLQRTDPEGVRLRGDVSDVAGHEFHDLSGAAVSATEAARLKFIPSEKDTAQALKTKLQRMLDLNRETMLQSYRTYGPENGGRRLPVVEEAIVDSIPQAAIDLLTADPNGKTRDFDKKYGKGAAKLVLR